MAFAKFFGNDEDHVVVMLDSGDEGPEVRLFFEPMGMGVCSFAAKFSDTDEGWDSAEKMLAEMTEEKARQMITMLALPRMAA